MVSSLKTFDVSKSGKMIELTQTKHRLGILVEFPYNIAYRKGFEISTGNTTHGVKGGPRCFRGLILSIPNTDRSEFVRDFQDLFGPDPVRDLKIFAGFGPDRGFKFFRYDPRIPEFVTSRTDRFWS